ncbi:flavodoxin domain-containing protein [Agaribacterium haliotis]|uniref:flavodoxin domain-containing protein n=1 Tax=Agaribacterium haliotis TaxID=2013869 RepID=UPI000BB548B3|nr:flavodoxin domain-containing protein [Agaribacterium haliotis]
MASFYLIVGSVMGTAEQLATAMSEKLAECGHDVLLELNYQRGQLASELDRHLIIISSTTGMGDLPANIRSLDEDLRLSPPNLREKPYHLICLGDSNYPNFAAAGFRLDESLQKLGAQRSGELLVLDAQGDEDRAQQLQNWLDQLLNQLSEGSAA